MDQNHRYLSKYKEKYTNDKEDSHYGKHSIYTKFKQGFDRDLQNIDW